MNKNLFLLVIVLLAGCGQPVKNAEPTPAPKPSSVTLIYEDNAQVELVTSAGRHIYLDVINPAMFTAQPTANDILLTTHPHDDHYYRTFAEAFPGKQLFEVTGKIEYPDVTAWTLAAGHNSSDPIPETNATNYICIIDTGGLRIAHFGDIGQDALTEGQLAALGEVDVAITQFDNPYSNMNATNQKGVNLMAQLKPRLILPHSHASQATIKQAVERWGGYYSASASVTLTPSSLPASTRLLTLGRIGAAYGTIFKLQPWK